MEKLPYLLNRLTDLDKIWHSNASGPYTPDRALEITVFTIQDGRQPPFLKIKQSPYLRNHLIDFDKIWHSDASETPQRISC